MRSESPNLHHVRFETEVLGIGEFSPVDVKVEELPEEEVRIIDAYLKLETLWEPHRRDPYYHRALKTKRFRHPTQQESQLIVQLGLVCKALLDGDQDILQLSRQTQLSTTSLRKCLRLLEAKNIVESHRDCRFKIYRFLNRRKGRRYLLRLGAWRIRKFVILYKKMKSELKSEYRTITHERGLQDWSNIRSLGENLGKVEKVYKDELRELKRIAAGAQVGTLRRIRAAVLLRAGLLCRDCYTEDRVYEMKVSPQSLEYVCYVCGAATGTFTEPSLTSRVNQAP